MSYNVMPLSRDHRDSIVIQKNQPVVCDSVLKVGNGKDTFNDLPDVGAHPSNGLIDVYSSVDSEMGIQALFNPTTGNDGAQGITFSEVFDYAQGGVRAIPSSGDTYNVTGSQIFTNLPGGYYYIEWHAQVEGTGHAVFWLDWGVPATHRMMWDTGDPTPGNSCFLPIQPGSAVLLRFKAPATLEITSGFLLIFKCN